MDPGRQHIAVMLQTSLLPLMDGGHGLQGLVTDMGLGQGLVAPLHDNFLGLGLVSFFHHHLNKFRLVEACIDQNSLTLLHIDTGADDQLCICSQNRLFHLGNSFLV